MNPITATLTATGLTRAALARAIGVHRSAVTRWADGRVPVPGPVYTLCLLLSEYTDTLERIRSLDSEQNPQR